MTSSTIEKEFVVLVDANDNDIGTMEKMEAHEKAVLHRAFSIFIFNTKGEMLIHQRAFSKYHTPGLWTNACCSHPRLGETLQQATSRRLREEMGMEADIQKIFDFVYKADVGQGLIEHEFDHVFVGTTDVLPNINREEVETYSYIKMDDLRNDINMHPEKYTVWFKIAFDRVEEYFQNKS